MDETENAEDHLYDVLRRGVLDETGYKRQRDRVRKQRRRLLDTVLSNATLEGQSVRYDLKRPFAVLSEMGRSKKWRARASEYRTSILEMEVAA